MAKRGRRKAIESMDSILVGLHKDGGIYPAYKLNMRDDGIWIDGHRFPVIVVLEAARSWWVQAHHWGWKLRDLLGEEIDAKASGLEMATDIKTGAAVGAGKLGRHRRGKENDPGRIVRP